MVEFDNYKLVDKGVCAAKGFKAGGINVGIKPGSKKRDLAVTQSALRRQSTHRTRLRVRR